MRHFISKFQNLLKNKREDLNFSLSNFFFVKNSVTIQGDTFILKQ